MDAIIKLNFIVSEYFDSWERHDICLLERIFDPCAKYIIRNKQYIYSGIKEITNYWIRNMRRQRNVKTKWNVLNHGDNNCSVSIQASFYDIEEQSMNFIDGVIDFHLTKEYRIDVLSEEYSKT